MTDFLTAAVMSAAFPTHDRMVTTIADAQASRAAQAYRARIAGENEYWAGLYGLVLTGTRTDIYQPGSAA